MPKKWKRLGHLAGGIAHDFNNILAGIIGYADITLSDAIPGSYIEKNMKQILNASERARLFGTTNSSL